MKCIVISIFLKKRAKIIACGVSVCSIMSISTSLTLTLTASEGIPMIFYTSAKFYAFHWLKM